MIAIFGGTFDPIHLGHLRLALELQEKYKFKSVRFIPCKNPVFKKKPVVSLKHRIAILKLAIKNQPGFIVDESEKDRVGPSYMIDTLVNLKEEMPKEKFSLILGSDAFEHFAQWRCPDDIVALAKLIVVPRDGQTTLPISATHIRKQLKAKKSPRYLVPDAVWQYIIKHGLYR
ncbi:MAG TPA: nicotinate (nicotinamide) nucleotide adenylyltransferase [Gammaproteobacteria bacterium]|nr:nicotinate (nicotinamide) nucleotide adenylyltransferase [Gammaproteobacteria bacterium]